MLRHQRSRGDKNNNNRMEKNGIFGHHQEPSTSHHVANGSLPTAPGGRSVFATNQAVSLVRTCGVPLSSGKKYLETELLTGERLYLVVDMKCKVKEVFNFACDQLGLQDKKLFGLTNYVENEHRFLDLDQKLVKIAPKSWKSTSGWGTDPAGNPTVILYLRVQIFVDFISVINCPVSLLHYYLQLRENTRIFWSDVDSVPEERCWEVAAFALQADFGDFHPSKHKTEYFRPECYFPLWVINGRGMDYITRNMPHMHLDLQGMSRNEAMTRFCREVSKFPFPTNIHFYGARKLKSDTSDSVLMGITTRGIQMQEILQNGRKEHVFFFRWPKIAKLCFERRKFTLMSMEGNKKLIFFTSSDEKSRYLLQFCRRIHQQTLSLQAEFLEARKQELNERKQFRESYVCTDEFEKEWFKDHGHYPESFLNSSLPKGAYLLEHAARNGHRSVSEWSRSLMVNSDGSLPTSYIGGQRVSMVSDASSNTTSGIVSDRQHAHDDSEAEQEMDVELDIPDGLLMDSSALPSPGLTGSSSQLIFDYHEERNEYQMGQTTEEPSVFLFRSPRLSENPPPPLSDKTLTEDDRSIGTTTNVSEKVATDDDREYRNSDHVVLPTESDYRLNELAKNAEATISGELTSLFGKRSLDKTLESTPASGPNFAAKTHRVTVDLPSSRESSLRGKKIDISELRQKTLNSFGSPKLKHLGQSPLDPADFPLVFAPSIASTPENNNGKIGETCTSSTQTGEEFEEENSTIKSMKTLATQTSSPYLPTFRKNSGTGLTEYGTKATKVDSASQANFDEILVPGRSRSYRIVAAQKSIPSEAETVVKVSVPNSVTESTASVADLTKNGPRIGISCYEPPVELSESNQGLDYYANLPSSPSLYRKVSHPLLANLPPYNYENIDGPLAPPYSENSRILPNSTSLQNIPTVCLKEPPNYEQALLSRAQKSATKRRTTVANGIDQELMAQIMAIQPSTSLQQAVSEPWLAEQMSAAPLKTYETSILTNLPNQPSPLDRVTNQGRSVSTNQIAGILAGNQTAPRGKNWSPGEQQQATNGGIYSKYAGQHGARIRPIGMPNLSGRGLKMNSGLSRVQSMPDHTRGDLYRQHFQQEKFFHNEEALRFPGPPSYQEAVISLEQKNRLHEIPTKPPHHQQLSKRNSLESNSENATETRRRSSFPSQNDNLPEKELNLAHLNQALKTSGQNLPFLKALFRDSAAVRGYHGSPLATPTESTPSPASTVGRRNKRPPDLSLATGTLGASPVASPSSSGRPSSWHEGGPEVMEPLPAPGSPLLRSLYYAAAPNEGYDELTYSYFMDTSRFASTPNLGPVNGVVFDLPPPPAYPSNCSRHAPPVGAALYSPSKLRQPVTTAYDR